MLRFDIIIIKKNTFARIASRVKTGNGELATRWRRRPGLRRYFPGVEIIAVVIERGSRICQRPASTRAMKSPQS